MKSKVKVKRAVVRMSHNDLPATVGLVKEVRNEVKADIRTLRAEMGNLRAEMGNLKSEMGTLRSEMGNLRSEMKGEMQIIKEDLGSKIHRVLVVVEEQRSENRIVLDALKNLDERQDRLEGEVVDLKKTVKLIARSRGIST